MEDGSPAPVGVECKLQKRLALLAKDLSQAKENARDKPWVLFLKERNTGRKVAVCDPKHYAMLYAVWQSNQPKENEDG
jgi:hypothetical protein